MYYTGDKMRRFVVKMYNGEIEKTIRAKRRMAAFLDSFHKKQMCYLDKCNKRRAFLASDADKGKEVALFLRERVCCSERDDFENERHRKVLFRCARSEVG